MVALGAGNVMARVGRHSTACVRISLFQQIRDKSSRRIAVTGEGVAHSHCSLQIPSSPLHPRTGPNDVVKPTLDMPRWRHEVAARAYPFQDTTASGRPLADFPAGAVFQWLEGEPIPRAVGGCRRRLLDRFGTAVDGPRDRGSRPAAPTKATYGGQSPWLLAARINSASK